MDLAYSYWATNFIKFLSESQKASVEKVGVQASHLPVAPPLSNLASRITNSSNNQLYGELCLQKI